MLLKVRVKGATDPDFSVVSYNILADCHMKSDWYRLFIDDHVNVTHFFLLKNSNDKQSVS